MTVQLQKRSSAVKVFFSAMKYEDKFIRYSFIVTLVSVIGCVGVAVWAFTWLPIITLLIPFGVAAFIVGDSFLVEYHVYASMYRREEGRILANQEHAAKRNLVS